MVDRSSDSEDEHDVVVAARERVADGVVSLSLATPDGAPLPGWEPGAHVDLLIGPELERQYSLCGDPDAPTWRIGVLREPQSRGGSAAVHERVSVGDRLRVRGPRNHFALVPAERYVLIAGGIGVTPILAMAARLSRRGAEWTAYYGGRQRSSMAFVDELQALGGAVHVVPEDASGLLPLASILGQPREGTAVYCCGPEGLLSAVEQAAAAWPAGALHVERFAPRVLTAAEEEGGLETFEIELGRGGRVVTVAPGQSILEACEEAGADVMSSCREGTCGTCEIGVLEGTPHHRDSFLTPEERASGEMVMACVSRSRSARLVLDL